MMDPGVIGLVSGEATMPVSSFIIQYSNVNYSDLLSADADLIITEGDGDDSPRVVYGTGHWIDVDDAFDLARAGDFLFDV